MACVAMGVTANAIGVGGIPGILSIQPPYMASFAVCMAIAAAAPFLLTIRAAKAACAQRMRRWEQICSTDILTMKKENM